MEKQMNISKSIGLIEHIKLDSNSAKTENGYAQWELIAVNAIKKIFGEKSDEVIKFQTADWNDQATGQYNELSKALHREYRLGKQVNVLDACIKILKNKETLECSDEKILFKKETPLSKKIFIVHGRDDGTKNTVSSFLKTLGLNPIILHDEPNRGQTIIEKFELHSNDVGFAIVLLTPDDRGGLESDSCEQYTYRARQNVIFELGYFVAKLGRERVATLVKENIEKPSDISGIIYTTLDAGESWKNELIRELKTAGIDVNV